MSRRSKGKSPVNKKSSWSKGAEGMRKAQAANDAKRNASNNSVYRFWLKKDDSCEIMILDEEPTEFRWEHNCKSDTGHWDQFYNCVQSTHGDHCPACQSLERSSYYAMFLSVVDFREYTNKDGKEIPFTRKLMAVKPSTFERWKKRIDRCIEDNGTLRGAIFEVSRSSSSNSPATGDDLSFIEMDDAIDEDAEAYLHSWVDKDNKKHTQDLAEVLDYEKVLPSEDESDLRKIFGTQAPPGSREEEDEDDDFDDEDEGFEEDDDEPPFDMDDEEDDDEEEVEEKPSGRSRRGSRRSGSKKTKETKEKTATRRRGRGRK